MFDFSESNYGRHFERFSYLLYKVMDDGIFMADSNNKFSMKLQGFTDEHALKKILNKTSRSYKLYSLSLKSTVAGQNISGGGGYYGSEITVNHPNCYVVGSMMDDTIIAGSDKNILEGNYGNDIIIVTGNKNTLSGGAFDKDHNTLISVGENNSLEVDSQYYGTGTFIIGGDKNTAVGGISSDTFTVYSYKDSGVSVTLTGDGSKKTKGENTYNDSGASVTLTGGYYKGDQYILCTGHVGVAGEKFSTDTYNTSNKDTINVAITDLISRDTIKIYNKDTSSLSYKTSSEGITITDNTGRINIFLPGQHDWDAIKGTKVYYNDQNGNSGTKTLAQLASSTLSPATVTGATVDGTTLELDGSFSGNLWAGKNSRYSGVKEINAEGTSKNMIIAGNSQSNLILGGSGKNSLWGGKGGNNTLTGGSSRDQYWFSAVGNDLVTNFEAGTSSNADVLVFYNTGFKNITRSGSDIIVTGSTGKKVTLETDSDSDTAFLYAKNGKSISGAKVGESSDTSLTYDSAVKYYKLNGNGTLNVTGSGNNKVSLTGGGVTYSGITNIDASDATGNNILVGSSKSANSIVGGSGRNSLWGGKGNYSDTLIGGDGKDVFWWTKNSGSDKVENASQDDTIKLMSIKMSDLARKKVDDNSITLTLKNGNTLTIENSGDITPTFNFAGGNSYVYNRTTNKWSKT